MAGGSLGRGNLGASSLGTVRAGTTVDQAFLTNEQALVEWAPSFSAQLFAEQALVDWNQTAALLTSEHALVEWVPTAHAVEFVIQPMVDFASRDEAMLRTIRPIVEWTRDLEALSAIQLLTEWVPGNVLTADRLRLVLGWSQSGQGNGDFYHRSLDDFALAELEQGGERDLDPNGGETGDGFPVSGHPLPPLPGDGAGLARYKDDVDDDTDWGPPLV